MHHTRVAVAVLALAAGPAARATPFSDVIELELLGQTIQQTFQLGQQLDSLRTSLGMAKEQLEFVRSMYGLVSDFKNFDPQQFMGDAKAYFLAQNSTLAEANWFAADVARNGIRGSFNPGPINRRIRDANIYLERNTGLRVVPYDYKRALGLGTDLESLLADPRTRRDLATAPPLYTSTSGILANDLGSFDPGLLGAVMQQRAVARESAMKAMQLYAESLGASPGKAQQLAAQAAGLTAAGVGQLSETAHRQLAIQELDRAERSSTAAVHRQEADVLWGGITQGIDSSFAPVPARKEHRR